MIGYDVRAETDWGNGTAVIIELNEGGNEDCVMMADLIKKLLNQNLDRIEAIRKKNQGEDLDF